MTPLETSLPMGACGHSGHVVGFVLVGAGSVGRGVFHQSVITPGVECRVVCDVHIDRALALVPPGRRSRVVATLGQLVDCLSAGELALCEDAHLAAEAPGVEVYFEASTAIGAAPRAITAAMEAGKHIVMMNAEADALFGPLFWREAQRCGVAYTSSDGDQPAVIARLVEELQFYGMELVLAGNIKGFLDRYTDPEKILPEAEKRGLDPQMCSSYSDGTKLCVEMSIVANALGCRIVKPGMLGPVMAETTDLFQHFDLERLWSPGTAPFVDYVLGAKPRGGVFAVGYTNDSYQRRMLDWFPPEIGPGPFYVLTRPYHLVHLETMRTVLEVGRTGRSLIAPRHGMRSTVICRAKRGLEIGTVLDGPGGFATYGLIENSGQFPKDGLPICLSQGARLRQAVDRDGRISLDDVDPLTIPQDALAAWGRASVDA